MTGLVLAVWALTFWRAYRIGYKARGQYDYDRGWRDGREDMRKAVWIQEEQSEVARQATIRENRRQGQLNRHAKRKGEA